MKIALNPGCISQAGVGWRDAEAGDDGMARAGDNTEEDRVGVLDHRPLGHLRHCVCWHTAEEKIRDVALEDDDLAVAREDAGEHADCALKDGDDGEHGGHAERDSRDADKRADPMAIKIREDELEEDHEWTTSSVSA